MGLVIRSPFRSRPLITWGDLTDAVQSEYDYWAPESDEEAVEPRFFWNAGVLYNLSDMASTAGPGFPGKSLGWPYYAPQGFDAGIVAAPDDRDEDYVVVGFYEVH